MRNYNLYEVWGVTAKVAEEYADYLTEHISLVHEAGKKLDVPFHQLVTHDNSKWNREEFPGYANHFKGGGDPDGFAMAWLHHVHNNPHHWQYWLYPDGFSIKDSTVEQGAVYMPEPYVLEMIADWQAMSMLKSGSWDISEWLTKNYPKIRLHSKSRLFLDQTLRSLGY